MTTSVLDLQELDETESDALPLAMCCWYTCVGNPLASFAIYTCSTCTNTSS